MIFAARNAARRRKCSSERRSKRSRRPAQSAAPQSLSACCRLRILRRKRLPLERLVAATPHPAAASLSPATIRRADDAFFDLASPTHPLSRCNCATDAISFALRYCNTLSVPYQEIIPAELYVIHFLLATYNVCDRDDTLLAQHLPIYDEEGNLQC